MSEVCVWCGSVEWLEQGERRWCANCGSTPEQGSSRMAALQKAEAAKQAAEKRHRDRRLELDRRAALVVEATKGLPMPDRIAAARLLLWQFLGLSAGEWDKRLAAWNRRAARPAEKAS